MLRGSSSRFRSIPSYSPKYFYSYRSYFISHHKLSDSTDDHLIKWKTLPLNQGGGTLKTLAELSKFKLSALVVLTSMSGHLMAASTAAATASNLAIFPMTNLGLTLLGTALCSFSANSLNQWAESALDSQMPRTRNRPLPRLALTPFSAFNWAVLAGASGLSLLNFAVNPVAAGMAGLTIVLYAGVYTPLKRISILNTWVGALVGAIPPLIGWTAICPNALGLDAFILPAVLFCWQFPHFNALSWNLRAEYARAGYKMASVLNPKLNCRVALRYSLALIPITLLAPLVGLTSPLFALTGNLINLPLIFQAFRFWRDPQRKSARTLFFATLIHLPLFMTFLFIHRQKKSKDEDKIK